MTGRNQLCRVGPNLSHFVNINRSIIQGSGLGPSLYIIMKSDMKTVGTSNILIKYADDQWRRQLVGTWARAPTLVFDKKIFR